MSHLFHVSWFSGVVATFWLVKYSFLAFSLDLPSTFFAASHTVVNIVNTEVEKSALYILFSV